MAELEADVAALRAAVEERVRGVVVGVVVGSEALPCAVGSELVRGLLRALDEEEDDIVRGVEGGGGFRGGEGREAYLVTKSSTVRVPHDVPFKELMPVKPERLGA